METLKQSRILILLITTIFICIGAFYLLWNVVQEKGYGAGTEMMELPFTSTDKKTSDGMLAIASKPLISKCSEPFTLRSLPVRTAALYGSNDPGKPAAAGQTVLSRAVKQLDSVQPDAQNKTINAVSEAAAANKAVTPAKQAVHASSLTPPITLFFTRTALLPKEDKDKATSTYTVTKEDLLLLQKIVMAEAEGEPYEGKVAVANVVLNRLRSANYPDTLHDVVYEKHQFSPVANGRLKRVNPNEDTVKAVAEALNGRKEVSDDTYYFLSLKLATDLSVHHHKKKTKTIGNHTFYK